MTFEDCLRAATSSPEMVREFDRLCGTNLTRQGTPLELAIDDSTGRLETDFEKFVSFVAEYVWAPLAIENGGHKP